MTGAAFLFALAAAAPSSTAPRCVDPAVVPIAGDPAFAAKLGAGSALPKNIQANVSEAFRRACADGLLDASSIITEGTETDPRLHLQNLPDGNVAVFSADQLPAGDWRLILEYRFAGSDGLVNPPDSKQIYEAIYCAVEGATEEEQARDGRCLAD